MKPLKIAFLWHQHQPDYYNNGHYLMPWTRLHGVKDYYDLPEIAYEFPKIKQTFNIVPSMASQILNYIEGHKDIIQNLTEINASNLTDENKVDILKYFFWCNKENLINKYKRYGELYSKVIAKHHIADFSEQDWRDLQVWYNLAWIGEYSKNLGISKRLLIKQRNFTEIEKLALLDQHIDILKKIIPQYKTLNTIDAIEISTSPFYHPILPLLIDSTTAKQSQPNGIFPNPKFQFPDDANIQVDRAKVFFNDVGLVEPKTIWSSEGSLSDETLNLFIEKGFKRTSTDEMILLQSIDIKRTSMKYFPYKYTNNGKDIYILFRDNKLSDKIGFEYQKWNPIDAVNDFILDLYNIRDLIVSENGEAALETAVITIVLDGENCWEYYQNNGIDFLRELYRRLSHSDFKTVTFLGAVDENLEYPKLESIQAGSWINGNFDIWIGSNLTNTAWNELQKIRTILELKKNRLEPQIYNLALNELLIAEGSDWFWWYCPYHHADNEDEFDMLFRNHLISAYKYIDETIPIELLNPLKGVNEDFISTEGYSKIIVSKDSVMRKSGGGINAINYLFQNNILNLNVEINQPLVEDSIKIVFKGDLLSTVLIKSNESDISLNHVVELLKSQINDQFIALTFQFNKILIEDFISITILYTNASKNISEHNLDLKLSE